MKFAQRLKWLRRRAAMTQSALSGRLGVAENSVYNWECERAEPGNSLKWQTLAETLGVSVVFLQHGIPWEPADYAALMGESELARRCAAAAQHARELISEVEQLRLDIAAGAKAPAQEVAS